MSVSLCISDRSGDAIGHTCRSERPHGVPRQSAYVLELIQAHGQDLVEQRAKLLGTVRAEVPTVVPVFDHVLYGLTMQAAEDW